MKTNQNKLGCNTWFGPGLELDNILIFMTLVIYMTLLIYHEDDETVVNKSFEK